MIRGDASKTAVTPLTVLSQLFPMGPCPCRLLSNAGTSSHPDFLARVILTPQRAKRLETQTAYSLPPPTTPYSSTAQSLPWSSGPAISCSRLKSQLPRSQFPASPTPAPCSQDCKALCSSCNSSSRLQSPVCTGASLSLRAVTPVEGALRRTWRGGQDLSAHPGLRPHAPPPYTHPMAPGIPQG